VRFVLGIGIGAKNATVPIFSSELAPARIRGALVMFWQLWVTFGASSPCAYVKDVGELTQDRTTRHLRGLRGEHHRQGHGQDLVAAAARQRVHPRVPPRHRHLVLPREPAVAHEEGQAR
jgi:hypothetical protein